MFEGCHRRGAAGKRNSRRAASRSSPGASSVCAQAREPTRSPIKKTQTPRQVRDSLNGALRLSTTSPACGGVLPGNPAYALGRATLDRALSACQAGRCNSTGSMGPSSTPPQDAVEDDLRSARLWPTREAQSSPPYPQAAPSTGRPCLYTWTASPYSGNARFLVLVPLGRKSKKPVVLTGSSWSKRKHLSGPRQA